MSALSRRLRRHRGPFTPGLMVAIGVGGVLHAIGLLGVNRTWRFAAPPPMEAAFVTTSPDTQRAREFAELFDPSPLFLPTKLNHGSGATHDNRTKPEVSPIPETIEAVGTVPVSLLARRAESAELTATGVAGVAIADTFSVMGLRRPSPLAPGRPRFELINETTGLAVAPPAIERARDTRSLPPAEFLVQVDSYGAQSPTLLRSTGDAALDQALRSALAGSLQKRPPAPGHYRAILAP